MARTPYTQKRNHQFRGPHNSEDYNLRLEENYKDYAVLYNLANDLEARNDEVSSYSYKELLSIIEIIGDLEERIASLENNSGRLSILSHDQLVTDEFDGSGYEVDEQSRCTYHPKYNILTLPYSPQSSVSKIKFRDADGNISTSTNLEMLVEQVATSDDTTTAVIESSQPVYAIAGEVGRVWHRNVITSDISGNGAKMFLYVRIPNDLSITQYTNAILLDVFPVYGVDITEISYSTDPQVNLTSTETWTPLNETVTYYDIDEAVGSLPPGAWAGDEIINAGPKAFYFSQKAITALRIGLRRQEYYIDGPDYIFTYGLSNLDIRYDKFSDSGSAIFEFTAPDGQTISSIDYVTPYMWNVPEYLVSEVFSYEVIWETSFESGNYTTTPVPLSQRVWIKVNMNKTSDGDQLPALSNLVLSYS